MSRPMTLRQKLDQLRHIAVAVTQQHHTELIPLFEIYVPQGGTVIDVGAHSGQFSKLFSRMVGDRGVVHAFEPSGYTRGVLEIALRANGCSNVVVHAAGLSDAPGNLTLHTPIKPKGGRAFGLASLGGVSDGRVALTETVPVITLDAFVRERGLTVNFVKADIEGWEGHLLRGAAETLHDQRPGLFLEIDDRLIARAGGSASDLFDFLLGLGYRATMAPRGAEVSGYAGAGDYLFRP